MVLRLRCFGLGGPHAGNNHSQMAVLLTNGEMANGLYRIKDDWRDGEDSVVLGSKVYVEIPESNYRDQGYEPLFDELPWRPNPASQDRP